MTRLDHTAEIISYSLLNSNHAKHRMNRQTAAVAGSAQQWVVVASVMVVADNDSLVIVSLGVSCE